MSRPGRASASQLLRWLREDRQSGPGRSDRVWKAARAGGAKERPAVQDGRWLRLDAAQLAVQPEEGERPGDAQWRRLARDAGLHPATLRAFNHRRRPGGPERPWTHPRLPRLRVGRRVFVPSTDEVLLARCVQHAGGRVARGLRQLATLSAAHNLVLLRAARARASGRIGRSYSNAGLDGAFLSPNPGLAGASDAPGRWETHDGRREHLVRWGADFWKCSVYLQDVLYHAGFVPHMSDHDHYLVAGLVHRSDHFREHGRDRAAPGDVWQRWGGDGVEQSHTGILASFVEVRPLPPQPGAAGPLEVWSFALLGAETGGAGVSLREQIVRPGTNETVEGKRIRFFAPTRRREHSLR